MAFFDDVKEILDDAKQRTENGALGYATTGKDLLDMNFKVAGYRRANEGEIVNDFTKAYYEDPTLAVAWLFYVRDVRGGLGERRLFRVAMKELANINEQMFIELLPLVAEYGRYDDIFEWLGLSDAIDTAILNLVVEQFNLDFYHMNFGEPISLLAKWLPTENCSNYKRKAKARLVIKALGINASAYRKTVSKMRKYLDVVEVKVSNNDWELIDYNTVPSCANLKYKDAFMRHDETRRTNYLESLKNGEDGVKINAGVLYPHDIVHKYSTGGWYGYVKEYDETIEQLWKNLPNMVKEDTNTLVVADGSGSMTVGVGESGVTALEVANALAIYFAEHNHGAFSNKYITFSHRPQLVDFSNATSLRDKLKIALSHSEVADTNIEATFDLILNTAIKNNYKQSDMPDNIVIISDMEFNTATYHYKPNATLFENIAERFERAGYKMPRLVFWNVNSRTNTIPVKQNEMGVALISGFSVNLCNMVLNGETDPYIALVKEIIKERYYPVIEVAKKHLTN